jgi:outer membrane protein
MYCSVGRGSRSRDCRAIRRSTQLDDCAGRAPEPMSTFPCSTDFYLTRAQEAKLRAHAAQEQVRNLCDDIAKDVRASVLHAQAAFQRIGVTEEMLTQSNMALDLAQAWYKLGLSGIVELSQAQLGQTEAEIADANARYAYQTSLAEVRFQTGQ